MTTLSYRQRLFRKVVSVGMSALAGPGLRRGSHPPGGGRAVELTVNETAALMRRVCNWQLEQRGRYNRGHWAGRFSALARLGSVPYGNDHWTTATLYAGIMAAYRATREAAYLEAALALAEANGWRPGPRLGHADDHCIGQSYLELYFIKKEPRMIEPIRETFERMMAQARPGREIWWWCDSLFMAPPVLAQLSAATGEPKYLDYMNRIWWDAVEFLYDPEEGLFYRDEKFKTKPDGSGRREKNGRKIFWSRGNGWVMAGLVRVLQYMPKNYADRQKYIALLRKMAARIAALQSEDGLWRASLLAAESYPAPETSGTALFCYSLAWAINQALLDRRRYLPVTTRAWQGLVGSVHASGKLGWVQRIGSSPKSATGYDTEDYGAGAFLLAGSEMVRLNP